MVSQESLKLRYWLRLKRLPTPFKNWEKWVCLKLVCRQFPVKNRPIRKINNFSNPSLTYIKTTSKFPSKYKYNEGLTSIVSLPCFLMPTAHDFILICDISLTLSLLLLTSSYAGTMDGWNLYHFYDTKVYVKNRAILKLCFQYLTSMSIILTFSDNFSG